MLDDPDPGRAAEALADPDVTVLATSRALAAAGPGWFQWVLEAVTLTGPPDGLLEAVRRGPLRWPGWLWGLLVGVGMIVAGLGGAVIHYCGLARGGIRRGRRWARTAYLLSGLGPFPTLLYYFGFGFFEPLHALTTVVLAPMLVAAVWRAPAVPRWTQAPAGPPQQRLRAATGQLLMVVTGFGLLVGGTVIVMIRLSSVFVGTDLEFLGIEAARVAAANERLPGFVAHDRAGFGGALVGTATAILLLAAWGWRRGERWVWWCLALGAVAGFGSTVLVHLAVGYTDLEHVVPVYLGIGLTAVALWLSRPFLCARDDTAG